MDRNSSSAAHPPPGGSNRSFGLLFAGVFAVIALWPIIHRATPRWWALVVALAFALVAVFRADLLGPLNRAWMRLGLLLSRITNPIVMAALFLVLFTPVGILFRAIGKDLLKLKLEPGTMSYWEAHPSVTGKRSDMTKQF